MKEGKLLGFGISTPEQDQNSLVDLMRAGCLDGVQVIYNIFEQEPQAEFFPVAQEHNAGVIVRVALDEGNNMPAAALKFALNPAALSTVIAGMRNVAQVEANCAVSDLPAMSNETEMKLHPFNWHRGVWYGGK